MELCVSERAGKIVVVLLDDDMRIVKPVYDFLKFQQQKSRATNTLKANGTDLCLFWTFLKKNGYAYNQVTPRMIAEFIDYLRGDKNEYIQKLRKLKDDLDLIIVKWV